MVAAGGSEDPAQDVPLLAGERLAVGRVATETDIANETVLGGDVAVVAALDQAVVALRGLLPLCCRHSLLEPMRTSLRKSIDMPAVFP